MNLAKKYLINKNVIAISCTILVFWIAIIIIAPLLISSQKKFLIKAGEWIYFFYQPTCHQMPDRSFLLNGIPMAVCIRCLSFYIGGLILIISLFFVKMINERYMKWSVLLCVPAILDFVLEKLEIYNNIEEARIVTGFLFGASIFYLIFLSLSQVRNKDTGLNI